MSNIIPINEIETWLIRKFDNYEVQSDVSRNSQEFLLRKQSLSTGLWKTWTVSLNNSFVLNLNLRWKLPREIS